MKAHINGITVEGTPQEIMEYQRLLEAKKPEDPFRHDPSHLMTKITCGTISNLYF